MHVFLTGATGFVGGRLLQQLLAEGHVVRALVRDPGKTSHLPRGKVEYLKGDVVSGAGIDAAIRGCEAAIHLVGIIVEKGSNTFDAVHHRATHIVVEAGKKNGIQKFLHMSALGARAGGVARYQTSKWRGEEEVRRSGIPFCILRPSLIFGPGDGFVTQMIDVMRKSPFFRPVPGSGRAVYRPVFIDDVASCFVRALSLEAAMNRTIELGGPEEMSLNQMLDEIAGCASVRKPAIHIPMPLMFAAAAMAERLLPQPPVTTDQLRMLGEGSTCDIAGMKQIFGIEPRKFQGCGRT